MTRRPRPHVVPDPPAEAAPEPERLPISREAADRMRALGERHTEVSRELATVDAQAQQFTAGLAMGLGLDVSRIMGVEWGEEPHLLLKAEPTETAPEAPVDSAGEAAAAAEG